MVVETKEGLKVPPPDRYNRNPATLEQFIIKSQLYIGFHRDKFKHKIEQVVFIVTRFKGKAYN
jgi:hypothetical protein